MGRNKTSITDCINGVPHSEFPLYFIRSDVKRERESEVVIGKEV